MLECARNMLPRVTLKDRFFKNEVLRKDHILKVSCFSYTTLTGQNNVHQCAVICLSWKKKRYFRKKLILLKNLALMNFLLIIVLQRKSVVILSTMEKKFKSLNIERKRKNYFSRS